VCSNTGLVIKEKKNYVLKREYIGIDGRVKPGRKEGFFGTEGDQIE
jgi:hypothetical protein